MGAFNDNLQGIANETKALQAVHMTAKTRLREEEQRVESLKAEIAEQSTNRDVGLLLPQIACCLLAFECCRSHMLHDQGHMPR